MQSSSSLMAKFAVPLKKRLVVPPQINAAKVRLRLSIQGPKEFRHYHIVAIPNKSRRDALPLEKLGEWDGVPKMRSLPGLDDYAGRTAVRLEKRVEWNEGRILWWLKEGKAEPTTRVVWLLEKAGLLVQGQHPWHNRQPPPFPINVPFTGNWPEYDPRVPQTLPGTVVVGTGYRLSLEGKKIKAAWDAEQEYKRVEGFYQENYGGIGPGGGARIVGPKWSWIPGTSGKSEPEGGREEWLRLERERGMARETDEDRFERELQESEDKDWDSKTLATDA